jgi:hypothetical protein
MVEALCPLAWEVQALGGGPGNRRHQTGLFDDMRALGPEPPGGNICCNVSSQG